MIHGGDFFLRFYAPIIAGLMVSVSGFLLKGDHPEGLPEIEIAIPFTPFRIKIPLPRALRRAWFARLGLQALAAFLVLWGLNTDFSKFFPAHLRMDVYFDESGIKDLLANFDSADLAAAELNRDWVKCRPQYDNGVKRVLARSWSRVDPRYISDTTRMAGGNTQGKGTTSFVVERVGIMAYRIVEGRGELQHTSDIPGREIRPFTTFFELRDSPQNHLRPSVLALIRSPSIVIRPEFKQALSSDPHRDIHIPFDHVMVGMTRIRLLPFPAFGNSLYLWRGACGGSVPIGYAVYY